MGVRATVGIESIDKRARTIYHNHLGSAQLMLGLGRMWSALTQEAEVLISDDNEDV